MLLAYAVMLLQVAEPVAPIPEDVVVIGQRLRDLRYQTRQSGKNGAITCRITKSSGDAELDTRVCDAARECGTTADTRPQYSACFAPRIAAIPQMLAAERRARPAAAGIMPKR